MISEERISDLAKECCVYSDRLGAISMFARAIEAECAKVPNAHELWAAAQLIPGEGIEDGVARIEAMIAAAPQPEPKAEQHQWDGDGERCAKCGDKDWMAGPICYGTPKAEQQEPVAFVVSGFDEPEKLVARVLCETREKALSMASEFAKHYPSIRTQPLYAAPPDLAAEVERLKEALRHEKMNTEVWMRDAEGKLEDRTEAYHRIAKLEAEVERLKAALNEARRHCANSEWNPAVGAAIATIDEGLK